MGANNGDNEWWRGGVIYQIYPRSFRDTSGDGVGDLAGIAEEIDYIAGLGVDAIWLSPFFKSPMKDFGYDVSDYRAVDPLFGTLEDFDHLLKLAHARGLKLLIDQVLSHTSDQHPWFQESRQDRTNAKADWYVWADPKPDGTPPNNWLSVFGGVAWEWEPRRRQYYLHNFLSSQPDLNFHNPEVQERILAECGFWLARGVDGFRLDTANFYFHDAALRDNPPRDPDRPLTGDQTAANPYSMQAHRYDKTQPENLAFLARLRALLDRYGATTSLGEIADDNALEVAAAYTKGGDRLHMAYTFDLLGGELTPQYVRQVCEAVETVLEDGWPCWSFSNHDVVRAVTRLGGGTTDPDDLARQLLALLLSLRGTPCIYQGEELGLPQAEVPFERLQDPYGITFWPEYKGRDGCRTPMPWKAGEQYGGFSEHEPWLPVTDDHRARAIDLQDTTAGSVLNTLRRFAAWRRDHDALRYGDILFQDLPEPLLGFERRLDGDGLLAVFNLGSAEARASLAAWPRLQPLEGHGFAATLENGQLRIPGHGAFFARLP